MLHCVLLTTHNVQVIPLPFNSFDNYKSSKDDNNNNKNKNDVDDTAIRYRLNAMVLYQFARPLQECILAVSRFTGVILLAQHNTK